MTQSQSHLSADSLVALLFSRAKLLISVHTIVVLAFLAYAFLAPPTYRATAVVTEVTNSSDLSRFQAIAGQLGGLGALAGLGFGGSKSDKHPVATLKSREFLERFIAKHDLLPQLFPDREFGPPGEPLPDQPTMWEGVTHFLENVLQVEENKVEGLITISVLHKNPVIASTVVNNLVADVNETVRERDLRWANQNVSFLNSQLENTTLIEIRQALYALLEAQMKTVMLASAQEEYVLQTIDRAAPPEEAFRPRKLLVVLTGGVLGFFVGVIVVLAVELLKRRA